MTFTKEQAIQMAEAYWWEGRTTREIVEFQLYEDLLATEFSVFHAAVEAELKRPVWTHEFAYPESLRAEFEKKIPRATFGDVIDKMPKDKPVIVVSP